MKKLSFLVLVSLFLIAGTGTVWAQSKTNVKPGRTKANATIAFIKSLKQEGWILDDTSKKLEEAAMAHRKALESEPDNMELIGETVSSGSLSVAHDEARHNAALAYAQVAKKSMTRGADEMKEGMMKKEDFDRFVETYERLLTESFPTAMQESLALYKAISGVKVKYQVYYLVKEEQASQIRIDAMNRAAEEVKASKEFVDYMMSFVVEKIHI